jgi:hypothetical protein
VRQAGLEAKGGARPTVIDACAQWNGIHEKTVRIRHEVHVSGPGRRYDRLAEPHGFRNRVGKRFGSVNGDIAVTQRQCSEPGRGPGRQGHEVHASFPCRCRQLCAIIATVIQSSHADGHMRGLPRFKSSPERVHGADVVLVSKIIAGSETEHEEKTVIGQPESGPLQDREGSCSSRQWHC